MRLDARSLTVLSAIVACLAGGCGPPRADNVVEFWALGREGEIVQGMVPDFERRHPGVRLHVQQIPWSAAHEKLLTAYVGEAMPDVLQLGNTWIPEFVALGALEPLRGRLAGSHAIALDDYFVGILETSMESGELYGLPWYVDTRLLFYRTDLAAAAGLSAPPRTWAEWTNAMARIRERAASGDFALLMPVNEWQPPVLFALQRGARLLRDGDTHSDFESAAFREAFTFYVELFRRGLAPLASQAQIANLYQDFARGGFAFYVTGPWNIGEFRARLPANTPWTTAPMPSPDDRYPGVSLAGGSTIAVFRGSPRKDLAWQLVEYLAEPAQQLELYRLTGDLPARKSAWTGEGPGASAEASAFRVQLDHVEATPKIPEWERIASLVTRYGEIAIRGEMTIDEALAALDHDVDEVLEKRRWLVRRGRERGS
jgi:multiple sugar transport system substrate-binding protein